MCHLKLIPRIFLFDEAEVPPELRSQRLLNRSRVPEIARYIVDNPGEYTCDLHRSVAPFSQHYLAWSHEFMIATVPHADRCVARAVLRQEVLEEDVAEDVETGLAAPSQGQMRPPWPYHTKETQHDEVSAADGTCRHRRR
jgi:hypothetical protein